jgi:hypothetical protein
MKVAAASLCPGALSRSAEQRACNDAFSGTRAEGAHANAPREMRSMSSGNQA